MPSISQCLATLVALLPAAQAKGFFIVQCGPLTVQRGDPIVSPGEISSHVHAIVGGTAFKQRLSNEEARNSKSTTCNKMLDKSNYWQPSLYHQDRDGKFELMKLLGIVSSSAISLWPLLTQRFVRTRIILTEPATISRAAKTATALPAQLHRRQGYA
jgi:hypothetical protein